MNGDHFGISKSEISEISNNLPNLWINSWFPGFQIMLNCTPMADDRWGIAGFARGKSEHHTAACRVKDAGAAAPKVFGVAVTESVTEKTPPVL